MSFQALGIIVIVLLGATWIFAGLKVSKKVANTDDYLVGGRQVGVALAHRSVDMRHVDHGLPVQRSARTGNDTNVAVGQVHCS